MNEGSKRASPGADHEKDPFPRVELSEEDAKKLQGIQGDFSRANLVIERGREACLRPIYEERREVLKAIPNFWRKVLIKFPHSEFFIPHKADKTALSYLEDVWVERHAKEHCCFTLEFHFKENPFFEDRVIKKEYNRIYSTALADEEEDEDGITDSMMDFEWRRDVEPSETTIKWKDDAHRLTKLYPRKTIENGAVDLPGSFFNFFE